MSPGSTGIVVDVSAVERACPTEMPDGQIGVGAVSDDRTYPTLGQKPFQQKLYRDTLPLGFVSEPSFNFTRNMDAHSGLFSGYPGRLKGGRLNLHRDLCAQIGHARGGTFIGYGKRDGVVQPIVRGAVGVVRCERQRVRVGTQIA